MLGAVEDEDRVLAEDRLEERVGLARAQVGLVAGEELLDLGRVGDIAAGAEAGDLELEDVAVARVALREHPERCPHEADAVDECRAARAGRQCHGASLDRDTGQAMQDQRTRDNAEVVRRVLEAIGARDLECLLELTVADIKWRSFFALGEGGGEYRGRRVLVFHAFNDPEHP